MSTRHGRWIRTCSVGLAMIGFLGAPEVIRGQEAASQSRLIVELEGGPVW